jgi:hypothetical protein
MAAIDFPNSPANGDTYTVGDRTWRHQDGVWSLVTKPVVTVSDTAPSSPSQGDLWFATTTGQTFIYFDAFWVEVGPIQVDDVVDRLVTKGDLLVAKSGNEVDVLGVGSNGQVLTADSAQTLGVKWAEMDLSIYLPSAAAASTYVEKTLIDAKGDLLVGSAADTVVRLGVGTNGQALVADSGESAGVKWGNVTSSGDDDQIVIATRMFT